MTEETRRYQPCDSRGLEEGLVALRAYAAKVKPKAVQRLNEIKALIGRLEAERQGERKELDELVSRYFSGEETVPERIDRCIAILDEIMRNPALSGRHWDTSQCVQGSGPCPPQVESPEEEQQNGSPGLTRRYRPRGYYDKHREEILADLKAMGYKQTLEKWNLTSANLAALRKRWQVRQAGKAKSKTATEPGNANRVRDGKARG